MWFSFSAFLSGVVLEGVNLKSCQVGYKCKKALIFHNKLMIVFVKREKNVYVEINIIKYV